MLATSPPILRLESPVESPAPAPAAAAAAAPARESGRRRKAPRRFCEIPDAPASRWVERDGEAPAAAAAPAAAPRAARRPAAPKDTAPASPGDRPRKRPKKRHFMEMAQLPGRWDGHRAYVSRVLCGQDCGEAAAPGGLLDAAAELATACLPYLDRVHVDFCLSEKGTAAFVAHTVPEPGAVGDDAEEVVLGGACARRAAPALFQVSFICVEPESKGRHMGAHLLKRLFSHARKYKVSHVATYADHGAVGFFLKHGFAKVSAADFPPGLYDRLDHYSESQLVLATLDFPGAERRRWASPASSPRAAAADEAAAVEEAAAAAVVAEEPEFDLDDVIDAAVLAAPGASAPGAAPWAAPDWAEPAWAEPEAAPAWAAPPDRAEAAPAWPEKADRAEAAPAWPEKPNRALLALRDTLASGSKDAAPSTLGAAPPRRAPSPRPAPAAAPADPYPIVVLPPIPRKAPVDAAAVAVAAKEADI